MNSQVHMQVQMQNTWASLSVQINPDLKVIYVLVSDQTDKSFGSF